MLYMFAPIRNLSFFSASFSAYCSLSSPGVSFDNCDFLELTEGNPKAIGYLESDLPLCADPGNLHLPWEAAHGSKTGDLTVDVFL